MTPFETAQTKVVRHLSTLIAEELSALSSEYWAPRLAPDQSDSELKFRRERIQRLRTMRDDFEVTMYGLDKEAL